MKGKKLVTISISGLALVLALVGAASAWRGPARGDCGFGDGHDGMGLMPGFCRDLNLTREQRERIRDIVESHRDEIRKSFEGARRFRDDLRRDILFGKVDEQGIRDRARRLGESMAEGIVIGSRIARETREVLTPEQREQLETRGEGPYEFRCDGRHEREGRWPRH